MQSIQLIKFACVRELLNFINQNFTAFAKVNGDAITRDEGDKV